MGNRYLLKVTDHSLMIFELDLPERAMEAIGEVNIVDICRVNKLIKTSDWSETGLIGTEATNVLRMETWHKLYQKFHRTV